MAIFNKDMAKLANGNSHFQQEALRDKNIQIVLMSLAPGEDIGEETHRADQSTFFVSGHGQAVVDGHGTAVSPGHLVVIPQGAKHNIRNTGAEPLKLFSVNAPRAEPAGVSHRTKAEAEAAEEGFVSRAAKAVKEKLGG